MQKINDHGFLETSGHEVSIKAMRHASKKEFICPTCHVHNPVPEYTVVQLTAIDCVECVSCGDLLVRTGSSPFIYEWRRRSGVEALAEAVHAT